MKRFARNVLLAVFVVVSLTIVIVSKRPLRGQEQVQRVDVPKPGQMTSEKLTSKRVPSGTLFPEPPDYPIDSPVRLKTAFMQPMGVLVLDRQVTVVGSIKIHDTRHWGPHFWSLRVYEGMNHTKGAKPFREHHYIEPERLIVFEPDQFRTVSNFSAMFELPPGNYEIELTHYSAHANLKLNEIKFGEDLSMKTLDSKSLHADISVIVQAPQPVKHFRVKSKTMKSVNK